MVQLDKNTQLLISASGNPGNNGTFFYNRVFNALNINAVYLARKFDDPEKLMSSLRDMNVFACSISSPLKERTLNYIETLSPIAQELKSINSIKRAQDGTFLGTNTDAIGFLNVLRAKKIKLNTALIYGAGGVVPSLVWAIRQYAPEAKISIAARNANAQNDLAKCLGITSVTSATASTDLFLNATPSQPTINLALTELSKTAKAVFDISGSMNPTELLKQSEGRQQLSISGFEMFSEQFKAQFEFYFERSIPENIFSTIVTEFRDQNRIN